MITATKNGITRNFSESHWKDLPPSKFGWIQISQTDESSPVSTDIIQKKMSGGVVVDVTKVVPEEIVINKKKEEHIIEAKQPERLIKARRRVKR